MCVCVCVYVCACVWLIVSVCQGMCVCVGVCVCVCARTCVYSYCAHEKKGQISTLNRSKAAIPCPKSKWKCVTLWPHFTDTALSLEYWDCSNSSSKSESSKSGPHCTYTGKQLHNQHFTWLRQTIKFLWKKDTERKLKEQSVLMVPRMPVWKLTYKCIFYYEANAMLKKINTDYATDSSLLVKFQQTSREHNQDTLLGRIRQAWNL